MVSNDGLVITTAHLVAGVGYVNLVLHDGTTRSAKVLLVDKDADLALVRSQSSHAFTPLPLRADRPGVGDTVTAYGTPYHPALSVPIARGAVTGDTGDRIETGVKVVAGNAGGPIVDRRGNVIGVVTWTRKRTDGKARARCVPIDTVLKSLRLSYD